MTFWNELSSDVQLLLVIAGFLLPIVLMIGIFTWKDARRRGMNHILWAFIAGLSPALMGFIIYLLVRSTHTHLLCTGCGHSVKASDTVCANCGAKLRPTCPDCGSAVEDTWKLCPGCAAPLPQQQEITPAVRPRNKALWAMLAMLLVIPVMLTYFVGLYVAPDPAPRYFHTRYALDTAQNESLLDPEYLEPESWFSYTFTNADGTTTVEHKSSQFSSSVYTVTNPQGEAANWTQWTGGGIDHGNNDAEFNLYKETNGSMGDTIYGSGDYFYDDQGRLVKLSLDIGQLIQALNSKPLYQIEITFSYDDAGNLARQELARLDQVFLREDYAEYLPEETSRRYVTYTYDEAGRLALAEEYDHSDTLTGYTEYTWAMDGRVRIAQYYAADGTAMERSVSEFDHSGNLIRQEFYDRENTLLRTVEFNYDTVEFLMRPDTLFKLALIWIIVLCFSGYIVSSVNKETY